MTITNSHSFLSETLNTDTRILAVGVADIQIGKSPVVLKTNLGSCVAVCLYDREKKAGGMLHCMLPEKMKYFNLTPGIKPAKFADSGIDELIHQLEKTYFTDPFKLTAKIFGGAKVIRLITQNIGAENETIVRMKLKEKKIPIVKSKTGGEKGYRVEFNLETGNVLCQVFGEKEEVL
jgi:chemotaxis protein CheD